MNAINGQEKEREYKKKKMSKKPKIERVKEVIMEIMTSQNQEAQQNTIDVVANQLQIPKNKFYNIQKSSPRRSFAKKSVQNSRSQSRASRPGSAAFSDCQSEDQDMVKQEQLQSSFSRTLPKLQKNKSEKPILRTPKAAETAERFIKKAGDITNRSRMGSIVLLSENPQIQEPITGTNLVSNKSVESKIKKIPSHVKHQSEQLLPFQSELMQVKKDIKQEKLIVFKAESIDDELQDQKSEQEFVFSKQATVVSETNKVDPIIDKHKKFLDQFEHEGRQIVKAIKETRRTTFGKFVNKNGIAQQLQLPEYGSIYEQQKVPQLALMSLKTQSSKPKIKNFSSAAKTNNDSQFKRSQTQSSLFSQVQFKDQDLGQSKFQQPTAPLQTSSKTLRSVDVRQQPLNNEVKNWIEPVSTQRLRLGLRVKQSFQKESKLLSDEVLKVIEKKQSNSTVFKNESIQSKTIQTGPDDNHIKQNELQKSASFRKFSNVKKYANESQIVHKFKQESPKHIKSTDINLDKDLNDFNSSSKKIEKNIQDAKHAQPQLQQHLNKLQETAEYQGSTDQSNPYHLSSKNTDQNQLKTQDQIQPQISQTFQTYFGKRKLRTRRMQKSQTVDSITKGQTGMRIKSVDFGKELADEVKYTTQEQLQADEIEDSTRKLKTMNAVEKIHRAPQLMFIKGNNTSTMMNEKEKYTANKDLIEGFNYDSQIQGAVIDEFENNLKNPNAKTPAFDQIQEAQNDVNQYENKINQQMDLDADDSQNSHYGQQDETPLLQKLIIRRFNNEQLHATLNGDKRYISKLRFFMQYPPKVRQSLIDIGIMEIDEWKEPNKVIFKQGGHSDFYYVILKGTVKIEQISDSYLNEKDMIPVVKRTCYDGDSIGALSQFRKKMDDLLDESKKQLINLHKQRSIRKSLKQLHGDQNDLNNLDDSREKIDVIDNGFQITEQMMQDLTDEQVKQLNANNETATTMEPCVLLKINKIESMKIIEETLKSDYFVKRVSFLFTLDLFQGINRNQLLPLISNIIIKKYRKGQYIQREGQEPEGLMIIRRGQCIVCTEKMAMRRFDKKHFKNNDNDWNTQEVTGFWMSQPQEMRELSKNRMYQNKLEYIDDSNKKIKRDTLIYKDILPFENLQEGDYFGGRALLAIDNLKNVKKQIQRQENILSNAGLSDIVKNVFQNRAHIKFGLPLKILAQTQYAGSDENGPIFAENLDQQILSQLQSDITSLLSVMANSAKVEVWLIDEDILNLLPSRVKNVVLNRLKKKQNVKIHGSKVRASDKAKTTFLKGIETQKSQQQQLIRNEIQYNLTSNVVRKRFNGGFQNESKYIEELEKVIKQDIERFPQVKIQLLDAHSEHYRFNKAISVIPMPVKNVTQQIKFSSACPCVACKQGSRREEMEIQDPSIKQKVVDIDLMQRNEDFKKSKFLIPDTHNNDDGQKPQEGISSKRKKSTEVDERKEEYGEHDRPAPIQVVHDIKKKFVEWELYKMSVLKDFRRKNKPKNKPRE